MQQWQEFVFSASDGLKLAGRKYGWENINSAENTPVVCLPSTTKSASTFHELALEISSRTQKPRRVLVLEYRGRGLSEHDKNKKYNILQEAEDTLNGLMAVGFQHVNIVASARGGLITMILSAMRPSIICSVVLNDIGPVIEARGLVRTRTNISMAKSFPNWESATEFVQHIGKAQYPNFIYQDWERQARHQFVERNGTIVPNCDPAILNTLEAVDLDNRIPDMWSEFKGLAKIPTLLIRGDNSDYLSSATVAKMRDAHKKLAVITVKNQGHTPDLATEHLDIKIADFFDRQAH